MSVPSDLKRLREHAEAAKSTSQAKVAMLAADAAETALSQGEHPDVLAEAAHDTDTTFQVYLAARAVEKRAYLAYTNPFGVEKTTGMG